MNRAESPELDPEISAQILQGELRVFAQLNTEQRERYLSKMTHLVKDIATPEVMTMATHPLKNHYLEQMGKNFGPPFYNAINDSLKTTFKTPNGEIKSWEGGYTAVMVNKEGVLLAAATNPTGRVYDQYGTNLFPYALNKAVFELHLNLADKEIGGLNDPKNFAYLEGLGFEYGKDLFLGTNSFPDGTVIGTSGCELSKQYMDGLLPQSMSGDYSVDFLAGLGDMYFARMITGQSMFHAEPHAMEEPKFFAKLRRAH